MVMFKCEKCGLEVSGEEVITEAKVQIVHGRSDVGDVMLFDCIKAQLDSVHSTVLLTVQLFCMKCDKVMPSDGVIKAREIEATRKEEVKRIKEKAKEEAEAKKSEGEVPE